MEQLSPQHSGWTQNKLGEVFRHRLSIMRNQYAALRSGYGENLFIAQSNESGGMRCPKVYARFSSERRFQQYLA